MLDHAKEKHRMKKKPYKRIVTVFFALDQIKKGYCYDYLQKVSDYTNWKYEYVRVGGREIL